jgi:hypothetical protein
MIQGFAYCFTFDGTSQLSSIHIIEISKEGKYSSCKFLLDPPSNPLLLDSLMSNIDGFPYAYVKKYDYIIPMIEES